MGLEIGSLVTGLEAPQQARLRAVGSFSGFGLERQSFQFQTSSIKLQKETADNTKRLLTEAKKSEAAVFK